MYARSLCIRTILKRLFSPWAPSESSRSTAASHPVRSARRLSKDKGHRRCAGVSVCTCGCRSWCLPRQSRSVEGSAGVTLDLFAYEGAQNKLHVIEFLESLGVDVTHLPRVSFVHLPLVQCEMTWNSLLVHSLGDHAKAVSRFRARIWSWNYLQLCEHNVTRAVCSQCLGRHCENDRRRSECVDCKGSAICEHDRIRARCVDCGGSQICQHDRKRDQCRECGGSQICQHDIRRSHDAGQQCRVNGPNSSTFACPINAEPLF
jgi:hypothetical protein